MSIKIDDDFLKENNFKKGSVNLISRKEVEKIIDLDYEKIRPGGKISNTLSTLSRLGIKSSFIGKVGNGPAGDIFVNNLGSDSVFFQSKLRGESDSNARSFILITPDSQRTMVTFLGCCADIDSEINELAISISEILYIEGFLWNKKAAHIALNKSIKIARKHNVKIALIFPDISEIAQYRDNFLKLANFMDVIFINEDQIRALILEEEVNRDKVIDFIRNKKLIIALTRGEKGSVIFDNTKDSLRVHEVETQNLDGDIVDFTGAGDAFAAGFLSGFLVDKNMYECAKMGNLFGGSIIRKIGARFDSAAIGKLKQITQNPELEDNKIAEDLLFNS